MKNPFLNLLPKSKYSASQIARWLWQACRGNRTQASLNAATGMASVVLSLASVWAMQRAIDIAAGYRIGNLYLAVAIMAALILADFGVNVSRIWIKNILGVKAQNRMQRTVLDRLLRAEWKGKESHHSGDITNRLENDVAVVVTFITETLPNTLSTLLLFIGAFLYLMSMDALLAIVTVAILPLFMAVSRIYVAQMRRLTRKVRNSDSEVQSLLQESVQNRMLIKTLEAETSVLGRLGKTQATLRSNVKKRTKFSLLSSLVLSSGFSAGYLVAFTWGAIRLSRHTLTFGGMTAFLQLVARIQAPARDLTKLVPAFVAVFTAAERLMELEEAPPEQQGEPIPMKAPCGIRFSSVSYAYEDDGSKVLNGLSFDFPPATCTAVLGETGAGKTTLVRLILALLRPSEGSIELYNDGERQPVSPLLRCNFVYVPQGNTLLSGTIKENLLLGNPNASTSEIEKALRTACADFVLSLPNGIDTVIGEDGGGLSEGQAQRIAIARALLRKGSVMLLDEATSALDPVTERTLLSNIMTDSQKTIIFITHRAAVIDYCHQTLKLT